MVRVTLHCSATSADECNVNYPGKVRHLVSWTEYVPAVAEAVAIILQELSSGWDGWPFGHNRHAPKSGGLLCPFPWESWVPSNTLWAEAYLPTNWHLAPSSHLATTDMGRKLGAVPLLGRELGSHLTQCGLGRGLSPHQVAFWSIQPFGNKRHGPNIGGCVSLGELGLPLTQCGLYAEAYLRTKWHLDPSKGLATIHQRHRQTGQTDGLETDRTDNVPIV